MMKFAQAMKNLRKEEKGFTLIELMVVIVIIGILAAVAVPKFGQIMSDSRFDADKASAKVFADAIERYYVQKGVYPTGDATTIASELVFNKVLDFPKLAQGDYGAAALPAVTGSEADATAVKALVVGDYATGFAAIYNINNAAAANTEKPQVGVYKLTEKDAADATKGLTKINY